MANRVDDPLTYQVEDFKARAQLARADARAQTTRAEIWEEASYMLQDAINRDQKIMARYREVLQKMAENWGVVNDYPKWAQRVLAGKPFELEA